MEDSVDYQLNLVSFDPIQLSCLLASLCTIWCNSYGSFAVYSTQLFHGLQLTDFGLSKVGLINSTVTDDLSGPAVSGTSLLGEHESQSSVSESQQERRKNRSAVGTPDYLAPEILLGTGHG